MNPYDILGIPGDSSEEAVQASYRRLAKETHPDLNPGDPEAAEKFDRITKAYNAIRSGTADSPSPQPGGMGAPVRRDVRKVVSIGLAEAFTGGTIRVAGSSGPCSCCSGEGFLPSGRLVVCSTCMGSGISGYHERGIIRVKVQCPECGGSGHSMRIRCEECDGHGVTKAAPAEVKVPPGCRDGTVFVVRNGASDIDENVVGDLEVVINILEHPSYRITGNDLETEVTIDVWDAALGASVAVPALAGGGFRLSVPPGTQPGRRFKLKGRGMPSESALGDLVVTVRVRVPEASSGEVKSAFESLRTTLAGCRT